MTEVTREQAIAFVSKPRQRGKSQYKGKCIICGHRPASKGTAYCAICCSRIEADRARKPKVKVKPFQYITWRGVTIEITKAGPSRWYSTVSRLELPNENNGHKRTVPRTKLLDLNHRLENFSREQVKALKRLHQQTQAAEINGGLTLVVTETPLIA